MRASTADLPVLGVDNVLLVPAVTPMAWSEKMLAAIFDNLDDVSAIHPWRPS